MQNKSILVISGHPDSRSLCTHLATTYLESARSQGISVEYLDLGHLDFDLNLRSGYRGDDTQPLEPDLIRSQKLIEQADHLVFVFPNWWASMPAVLKGWIDRVFLPGFAFRYRKDSPFPEQLLKGKSARIIITMDAPPWYYRWFNGAPGLKLLKKGTLEFCGIKPVATTLLGPIRGADPSKIQSYIQLIQTLGAKGK